jgi:hypothetical protein
MPVRRGVASFVLTLSVMLAMAVGAPTASAVSVDTVKGGETALFVPFSDVVKLAQKRINISPISPAYLTFNSFQEGPALRFPVSGGLVESATMLGTVDHAGGMLIQKFNPDGTLANQLEVTTVRIVNGNMLVGNAFGLVPAPTADLVNATHSKNPTTGVIHFEADAKIGIATALVLNTYFNTTVFNAGLILGHVKSDIKTKTKIFVDTGV